MLHGFGQPLVALRTTGYFHEGVDMNGSTKVDNEYVRAPAGGIVNSISGAGDNLGIGITVFINGQMFEIELNHLLYIDAKVKVNESIEQGQIIGKIYSGGTWATLSNHTHFGYWPYGANKEVSALNPFTFFTQPAHQDPQFHAPMLKDVNKDGKDVKYRKTPDSDLYYEENEVHNAVDFEVEVVDHQSIDEPFEPRRCWLLCRAGIEGEMDTCCEDAHEPLYGF